jgi:hypothetical protein
MAVKFDDPKKLKGYLDSLDRAPVVVPPASSGPAKPPEDGKRGS